MKQRSNRATSDFSFSGHETFPLRLAWLKKAVDAVKRDPHIFSAKDAIASFGVGKNMVRSIRHWALAISILEPVPCKPGQLQVTPLGEFLMDDAGADPYCEDSATLWLLHWLLCRSRERATLWHFVFGHWREGPLEFRNVQPFLEKWLEKNGGKMPSASTLRRDLQCLTNTYVAPRLQGQALEDVGFYPLASLGLLFMQGSSAYLRQGRRGHLPAQLFAYCVLDYWDRQFPETAAISSGEMLHGRASPGQVFLLGDGQFFELVSSIESLKAPPFYQVSTAGVQQLYRVPDIAPVEMLKLQYIPSTQSVA